MSRAILLVLDSFGCGGAEDAGAYGDVGADTLGHIAKACANGVADRKGLRSGPLLMPYLDALGLGRAAAASTGTPPPGLTAKPRPEARWGYGVERAQGKDTPSGHWEMAGAPATAAWGLFPDTEPCFPAALIADLIASGDLPGILGNCHAAGTAIVESMGAEHVKTLKPIVYTSVDSVFQIAAHEEAFGLARLYDLCRVARRLCDPLNIGRVIARPFRGDATLGFTRTANRKDFAVPPPAGNLLEQLAAADRSVVTIGKIGDIFAHRFTGTEVKRGTNMGHFDATLEALPALPDGGMIFTNFLDFDSDHGHRRDVAGYAHCLETFDKRWPDLEALLRPGDIVVLTADHGNDPTFRGTDHTREHVPILTFGPGLSGGPIGRRETFADIGATIAAYLNVAPTAHGTAWI